MRIPSRAEVDAVCGSPSTRWQRVLDILAPAILILSAAFVLIRLPFLPAEIPTHYGMNGEVDGTGSRWTLLALPLIGLATDLLMAISARFPKSWNTGVRVTVLNRARVYRAVRDLVAELRLCMALLFGGFGAVLSLLPETFPTGAFIAVALLSLIPLIRYFVRVSRR